MSFHIPNLLSPEDFQTVLQDRKIVLVRFGAASTALCQRIDRHLAMVQAKTTAYFRILACELRDMPIDFINRYRLLPTHNYVLVFFSNGQPISLAFGKKPPTHLLEHLTDYNDILSALIYVQHGIFRGQNLICIPDVSDLSDLPEPSHPTPMPLIPASTATRRRARKHMRPRPS
ncbi:hypothetical protein NEHOM01_0681 [Nematocida homosporus]|uniref:uncharacterized protein n=1 Tax=Nematocida homosporus TaxID=1912981 RepID=UPI0022204878|nr:uncharacterized protein NEHOM01_0681 [Nematocida homosporus]KAI5185223.1 hypothetical protein NEHOM01_0681 [Nematocida homosporus]